MKRVMIVGQPGAGKSTLARDIGRITDLPVFHVDMIHWMPGWVERDMAEKLKMAHEIETKENWVFEGGLSQTWRNRFIRADTLICLDFPLWLRLWRVVRRTLREYGQSRLDLPQNCPERFNKDFYVWIWKTRHTGRQKMHRLMQAAPADKAVYHLRNRAQVETFLAGLERRYA